MSQGLPGRAAALRLRALAHPLRWKLIDLVEREELVTATRCSEVLGVSVASCSYHLSILGKYGYIEQLREAGGRERPWRQVTRAQDIAPAGPGLEVQRAAEAASEAFLDNEVDQLKRRIRSLAAEPPEWRRASRAGGSNMHVTADELHQIWEDLAAILLRYAARDDDPSSRPDGSRRARVFVSTSVDPL